MANMDEPMFQSDNAEEPGRDESSSVRARVRRLMVGQDYGVLCTQGAGQPYGSLVAFAVTENLRQLVFATPSTTRKYRLLSECRQVALVCDDRASRPSDLMRIEAVTATGVAKEILRHGSMTPWRELLVTRHPHLEAFVAAPSCALFRVDILRYFHVVRFQQVGQWTPTDRSFSH